MIDGPQEVFSEAIAGRELDGYTLETRDFKQGRTGREAYFNVFLARGAQRSLSPIVQGLFFVGRGEYINAWIEFRYEPRTSFTDGTAVDLEEMGLTMQLFSLLAGLIPPGGSMMAIYGAERHPIASDTEKGLKRSFPPAATPLGYQLWKAGMRWFKDWYFPEGWMEGGMKLQGTRPLREEVRVQREARAREELEGFVSGLKDRDISPFEREALARAEDILSSL